MHKILTKWIEPYVLLEKLKKQHEMNDFTFDGFSKQNIKNESLKKLEKGNSFGLYMKNVNKFYLFQGKADIDEIFGLTADDYELTDDVNKPFEMVDLGKAEAGFIFFS